MAEDGFKAPDHEERMRVAELLAGWELGSTGWAGRIIGAYLNPNATAELLRRDMGAER